MITVHHLNNSRSQRVLWLLEELGLPYDIRRYQRDPQTMLAPPELQKVHPLGKSPVITDDATTVAESGAIIEYLIERHGNGRLVPPAGTPERLRWRYWMHFAEGSAMPPLLLKLVFDKIPQSPMPFFVKPIARGISAKVLAALVGPNLKRQLDFMEGELGRSEWFAGNEFSAADVQMSFPVEASAQRAGLDASRPRLMAWLKRIHARAGVREGIGAWRALQLCERLIRDAMRPFEAEPLRQAQCERAQAQCERPQAPVRPGFKFDADGVQAQRERLSPVRAEPVEALRRPRPIVAQCVRPSRPPHPWHADRHVPGFFAPARPDGHQQLHRRLDPRREGAHDDDARMRGRGACTRRQRMAGDDIAGRIEQPVAARVGERHIAGEPQAREDALAGPAERRIEQAPIIGRRHPAFEPAAGQLDPLLDAAAPKGWPDAGRPSASTSQPIISAPSASSKRRRFSARQPL